MVAPGSLAASPAGGKTWMAPYHGVAQSTSSSRQLGTCSTSNLTLLPTFTPRSGVSRANVSASTASCTGVPPASSFVAFAVGDRILSIPITFIGTHHTLELNWTFSGNASTAIRLAGSCPSAKVPASGSSYQYCDLSANAEMDVTWRLLNQSGVILPESGGNGFSEGAYSEYDVNSQCSAKTSSCTNSTYSQLGTAAGGNWSGTFTHTFSFKLTPRGLVGQNHHYILWIQILAEAYTEFEFYPSQGFYGTMASAALNFNAPGYGAKLNSIAIA